MVTDTIIGVVGVDVCHLVLLEVKTSVGVVLSLNFDTIWESIMRILYLFDTSSRVWVLI